MTDRTWKIMYIRRASGKMSYSEHAMTKEECEEEIQDLINYQPHGKWLYGPVGQIALYPINTSPQSRRDDIEEFKLLSRIRRDPEYKEFMERMREKYRDH